MSHSLKPVLNYLNQLKKNNDRTWFNAHKKDYENAHKIMIDFADSIIDEMRKHDNIGTTSGKKSLFRIYRDVRFSKNKLPYKTSWNGSLKRATLALRGGYYYHVEPGNTYIAGGFFGPNPDDLKHIRKQIAQDDGFLRDILNSDEIRSFFGDLKGEKVKTAPKGFAKDHQAIDLLRYKQFILTHSFSDSEVLSKEFHLKISDGFRQLRPFFNVMSEILTTDLNGISLI